MVGIQNNYQSFSFQGWRCNAVHTQMYMLEGGSRWDIDRAREAVDLGVGRRTRLYDVHLMSNINSMSQRILGYEILSQFKAPGKPTSKINSIMFFVGNI